MASSTLQPTLNTMPGLMAHSYPTLPSADSRSDSKPHAVVVGLYGVPGSGKTFLLNQLKHCLEEQVFAFYEGSEEIASLVPGGLDAFLRLKEQEKVEWRQLAIERVGRECAKSGRVAVITGHFMFWSEAEETGLPVYTQNDLDTFTHILYLDVPSEIVIQRRVGDPERKRPSITATQLGRWQQTEKAQLGDLCRNHGILFMILHQRPTLLYDVAKLLRDFQHHNEEHNLSLAKGMLDNIVAAGHGQLETMLILDADKTLTNVDTGSLFWERASGSRQPHEGDPLKALFSSPLGYTYTAFRQATLLYEEAVDDGSFDAICQDVASAVVLYPEFLFLLQQVGKEEHVGAVVVSCGLRRVWEKVFEREGLSETVKIIGGGRIRDEFVVTAGVKAALVTRLRTEHMLYTWAFGDSPLDLEMLREADHAIVVTGEEQARSKTMDAALMNAIDIDGLHARQVLLPSSASPRLDTSKLPLIQLMEPMILDSIFCRRIRRNGLQIFHATDRNAAKLLMTPMRDAKVAGPALREIHRRVGQYLATEFLSSVIGTEAYSIPHVQGHQTSGYRLLNEQKTSIIALMRGGEPMAFGVNDAYPLARFIHASAPEDVKLHHLEGQLNVVLVDSVVNNGQTVVQFVQHIRRIHEDIRIVVIAGVVQEKSVSDGGLIHRLGQTTKVSLIALRMSENKFTGKGTTDTGNRLFNTTHIP